MWPLAVLTSDRITVFFSFLRKFIAVFSGQIKLITSRNNKVTVLPRWSWGGLCKERLRQRIALKSLICGVFVAIAVVITSSKLPVKTRRRQRQRQLHKSLILLVEWGKMIVLHVRQPLHYSLWCFLPMKTRKFWIKFCVDREDGRFAVVCSRCRRTSTLEISRYH